MAMMRAQTKDGCAVSQYHQQGRSQAGAEEATASSDSGAGKQKF